MLCLSDLGFVDVYTLLYYVVKVPADRYIRDIMYMFTLLVNEYTLPVSIHIPVVYLPCRCRVKNVECYTARLSYTLHIQRT